MSEVLVQIICKGVQKVAKTVTDFHRGKTQKFTVGLIVEFYREMDVIAVDETEAGQLAEERLRSKHKVLADLGYVIGDVEIINVNKR